jgi:hypothetical protein
MQKITAIAVKEEGKPFRVINSKLLKADCDGLPKGRYRLTVEKYRKNKSNSQLGYLFAAVYPLVLQHLNDAGWEFTTLDQVDAKCKELFSDQEVLNRDTGEIMKIPALKRDMTTTEMMTYINAIRVWDAEYLGGIIPEPGENFKIDFDEST